MKSLLLKAGARMSKVRARVSKAGARLLKVRARRPLALSLVGALLVALVGVTILLQMRAHASPEAVSASVVSDTSDTVTDGSYTGPAVYTYGHIACPALDSNNLCTAADVPPHGFTQVAWPLISDAHWIWETQLSQSSQNNQAITFSKTFDIAANNTTSITGNIQIAADNEFALQVNGTKVGTGNDWQAVSSFSLDGILHAGQNTITVEAINTGNFDPWGNPGGLIYDLSYSYVPDITPPVTSESFSGLAGSNGWYRGLGAVTLQAGDPDDATSTLATYYSMDGGSSWNTYSSPLQLATDGQYTVKYFSIDPAGNVEAIQKATINLDQTPPALNINGSASATYSYCAGTVPTRPTFAPTDNLSGLDGSQGDSWTIPSTATGAGPYTYTAHASDMAGNSAQETRTYTVAYGSAFSGVLSPVSADGSSSFTLGSTIPVKFQLLCNGVPVTNAVARLMVSQNDSAPGKAISGSTATTDNLFRYDSTSQQYIFNLSTKNGYTSSNGSTAAYTAGSWTLTIMLDDGSSYAYTIALS